MGIPRFFRYLSERFPLINENIVPDMIPEFDNLYLDMNGIIHTCSHNNTGGLCVADEKEVFVAAFQYILRLFHIIKPKKLFYMAVDGCAPRAKMNQQRSRRFRAANDAREGLERALEAGEEVNAAPFDSNCITPGTEFMESLTKHLHFFIQKQIEEDPLWQEVTVVLSGPDVPGEGEHKIVDYIRSCKAQPDYDPNVRHCMYGLDADLIMLSLATHEPHFALLREEVIFGKGGDLSLEKRMMFHPDRFQLLHISTLREYMALEFAEDVSPSFTFDVERLIDDFILFCMLVGNDFLPHLPLAEIGEGGLQDLVSAYKEHLRKTQSDSPWLTQGSGIINFVEFAEFLKVYAALEEDRLDSLLQDDGWVLGKKRMVGPGMLSAQAHTMQTDCLDGFHSCQEARDGWYYVKFQVEPKTPAGLQQQNNIMKSYIEGLQWVLTYYFRGPTAASWSWYFPYYHAPFAFDLSMWPALTNPPLEFEHGQPFFPFQQLMAVLPSPSRSLLPKCYQWLFHDKASPILSFYPENFQIDQDGVKVPWGGVTLIPFIDPARLLEAMATAEARGPPLLECERKRNAFGVAHSYRFDRQQSHGLTSPIPQKFEDMPRCRVHVADFAHLDLPEGVMCFPSTILPGCDIPAPGFPTLKQQGMAISHEFGRGVKVFQMESREPSLILHLHPTEERSWEEKEAAFQRLLTAPCAHLDFPFAHQGKVVAIYTPSHRYLPGQKKQVDTTVTEHESWVWELANEVRRKGVVVGPVQENGRPSKEQYRLPVAEVKRLDGFDFDGRGKAKMRLKEGVEYRLLPLVREAAGMLPQKGLSKRRAAVENWEQRSLQERFPDGSCVLCMDPSSECFGTMGVVEKNGDVASMTRVAARFASPRPLEELAQLDAELKKIGLTDYDRMQWHKFDDLPQLVAVDRKTLRTMLGTVRFRDAEDVRDEIGMNMVCELKDEYGRYVAQCLPSYSAKYGPDWWFSDLAVEAIREYKGEFPDVFKAIKNRRDERRDLQAEDCFPGAVDVSRSARRLCKYCKSSPFKQLKLVPENYLCLTPDGVREVSEATQRFLQAKRENDPGVLLHGGSTTFFQPDGPRSQLPKQLFSRDAKIGDRGVYIQPEGVVPVGVTATVVGVYASSDGQKTSQLELLLDTCFFAGSDLCGRTPPMRGLLVPSTAFLLMPVQPRSQKRGETAATASQAKTKKSGGPSTNKIGASQQLMQLLKGSDAEASNAAPAGSKAAPKMIAQRPEAAAVSFYAGKSTNGAAGGGEAAAAAGGAATTQTATSFYAGKSSNGAAAAGGGAAAGGTQMRADAPAFVPNWEGVFKQYFRLDH